MPDLRERRCQPTGPLPATDARLLIVDGAAFLDASGARRGVVVPATAVIGSAAQAQSAVGMSRVYVCSDRAVTFRSALNCAYTRMTDGETRVGTTSADIDIRLKRGWNVLTARTVRPDYTSSADSPMTVLAARRADLALPAGTLRPGFLPCPSPETGQWLGGIQERANRRETAAVRLADAQGVQGFAVSGRAVSLVGRESIAGVPLVQLPHQAVAFRFGQQAGGGHAVTQGVGAGRGAERQVHPQLQVIRDQGLRSGLQPRQGAQGGGVRGPQDIQAVDLVGPGMFHRPGERHAPHLCGVGFALRGRELLAVPERVLGGGAGQNHGGHRHRACPRPAPGLVHACHAEVSTPPVFPLEGPVGRDGRRGGRHAPQGSRCVRSRPLRP